MKPQALLGDAITCPGCPKPPYCPTGVIATCHVPNVIVDGRPPAVLGDLGECCGVTVLLSGCPNVIIGGIPAHLVGDPNTCGGTTIGPGAPTVLLG